MLKNKNLIYLSLFFILFFSCKSTNNKIKESKKVSKNENKKETEGYIEKYEFEYLSFNYSINSDESKIKKNDIYELKYEIIFKFVNNNSNFKIKYTLFDENNNKIIFKDNIKPVKDINEKNIYIVKDYFNDIMAYSKIRYSLIVEKDKEIKEYSGDFENIFFPYLNNFRIGPIITKYVNNKLNVSLSLNLQIINCNEIKWIHLIPPSLNSYWNIPWIVNDNEINANSMVFEENKNFIENGKYVLQINFNKYGIIQKEVEIIDLAGNKIGENYGLTIINVEKIDKKMIKIEFLLFNKLDYIEIWFFENNYERKKLGFIKIAPANEIYFDNIMNKIKDDNENTVKIEYNKDYKFRLYSFSKEINGIKYISISDEYTLNIYKFKLFPFSF